MNSKYACVSALIVIAILISGVSAADNDLINKDFGNKDFTIDIPSDSDFNKEADTHINIGDLVMNMELFENKADNSKDLAMVLYLKDSSNENMISKVIDDLEKDGDIVEENGNYLVVKNKNSKNFNLFDFDLEDVFNAISNLFKGIFSQDGNVNVTTNDTDVKVSNDGINIIDSNGTKVSLSSNGLKVSDDKDGNVSISTNGLEVSDNEDGNVSISANGLEVSDDNGDNVSVSKKGVKVSDNKGENVSVSKKGVKVSGNGSSDSDNDSIDGDISISDDMISNIDDADYTLCIKNQNNTQLIVLVGNDLDLMKSMADTASFTEN